MYDAVLHENTCETEFCNLISISLANCLLFQPNALRIRFCYIK